MHYAGPARGVPGAEGRYRGSPSLQYRETTLTDGTVVVSVGGDLDLDTSATLKQRLLHLIRRTATEVVVDMDGLAFLDSFGLSALIAAWREADLQGIKFALASVPDQASRVLQITNTAPLFRIVVLHEIGGTARVSEDAGRTSD